MKRPIVGVVGNQYMINDQYPVHAAGRMTTWAVSHVSNCAPMIVPTDPEIASVSELIEICDGFVFTGGRPNVHPEEYGEVATDAHGDFDRGRDAIALGIIRACVERGQPIFGICRGFQEVAVAMGSTLHPEIRDRDQCIQQSFKNFAPLGIQHSGRCHQMTHVSNPQHCASL